MRAMFHILLLYSFQFIILINVMSCQRLSAGVGICHGIHLKTHKKKKGLAVFARVCVCVFFYSICCFALL